jgi:hypothetical protein
MNKSKNEVTLLVTVGCLYSGVQTGSLVRQGYKGFWDAVQREVEK